MSYTFPCTLGQHLGRGVAIGMAIAMAIAAELHITEKSLGREGFSFPCTEGTCGGVLLLVVYELNLPMYFRAAPRTRCSHRNGYSG